MRDSEPDRHPGDRLRRELSLTDATLLCVASVIGSGIFLTPGSIAARIPDPSWILAAWMVGGLLSLAGALANAELGAMYPHAGGDYVYLREAFHPGAGFLMGWLSFLAIFTGTDTHLSAVLAAGGAGAITALAGVRGDLLRRVWDGRAAPDRAAAAGGAAQVELDAGRALLDGWPAVAALKAALAHRIGGDAWRVRPPLCDLPANEGEAFREALARIGAVAQGVD